MFSSPVAVDLNGDGRLEVIVTTAVGFVYVLEADGTWNKQFSPESMSSIYASATVDDFNNDGDLGTYYYDLLWCNWQKKFIFGIGSVRSRQKTFTPNNVIFIYY